MEINSTIKKVISDNNKEIFFKDITSNLNYTYKDFFEKSNSIKNYFQSIGLCEGNRILVKLDNSYEYFCLIFACLIGNYVICPVDTNTKDEKFKQIKKILKPKIIITSEKQTNGRGGGVPYDYSTLCTYNLTTTDIELSQ